MDLAEKKCVPCHGGIPPLTGMQAQFYMSRLDSEWKINEEGRLQKEFKLKNFKESMAFVNKVAEIAEAEGHHPDIYVYYNRVKLILYTHAINGLHENDFIVAAKIDKL